MVIKDAIRGTDHGLAVALRIPRNAYARLNVVLIGLNSFLNAEVVVSGLRKRVGRFELRRNLHVITYAVIDGEVRAHPPGILPERSNGYVVERIARAAE